jgi:hypothetical protein
MQLKYQHNTQRGEKAYHPFSPRPAKQSATATAALLFIREEELIFASNVYALVYSMSNR